MFESALHRRVALAVALVALALSGASAGAAASTPVSTPDVSTADESAAEASRSSGPADRATDAAINATVVREGDRLVLRPDEDQTVRVRTDAEQGTELDVELWANGSFRELTRATVAENGTATATLDLATYEAGTEVRVVVRHDDEKVGEAPGVVAEATTEFVHEGDRPVLRAAENQSLRLRTDAEPGRELTVRVKTDSFLKTATAVVAEDGTASATFDLSDASAGTEFSASVFGDETAVEGVLVNESATVHRDGTLTVSDPSSAYEIRGQAADPTVTTLDVRVGRPGSSFSSARTVAVGDDGTFAATFDLSSLSAGSEIAVEVGGIPREVDPVVVTEASRDPVVYAFVETPPDVSVHRPGERVLVHPAPNQTIRGTTNLRPGTQLVVTAEDGATNAPGEFSLSETVTVGEDGTFAATMDFGGAEAGTNFTVAVERGPPLAAVEGRVVDESVEIPTTSAEDDGPALDERLVVAQAEDRRVRLETDADPGEEVTVVAKADGQFYRTDAATVAENGTVPATFDFSEVAAGTEFKVAVEGEGERVEGVVVSDTATIEGDEPLTVRTGANLTVRGETTADPGTRLVLTVRGTEGAQFRRTETATVSEGGSFAATVEFADAEPGTAFAVEVVENATLTSGSVEGRVVAEATTANESGVPFTTGGTTTTPDDGSDGHADEFGVPGFGVPVALVAVVTALALASTRRRRA